jgi:DNA-binding MarR family transcriptional regulator
MESGLFLNTKAVRALVTLSDKKKVWYASMVAKEADVTYAHLIKLLDAFADAGLVTFEKQGRVKIIRLTDKGEELAHEFEAVLRRLEGKKK